MAFCRIRISCKTVCEQSISAPPVEIIRVDCGERFGDFFRGTQNRVPRSPRLGAFFRSPERSGELVQFLESVFHLDFIFPFRADVLAERLFDVVTDHENDFAESAFERIVNGIVQNDFAGRTDRINLLESAVTASHSGGEHQQCRFHRKNSVFALQMTGRLAAATACPWRRPFSSGILNSTLPESSGNSALSTSAAFARIMSPPFPVVTRPRMRSFSIS